MSSIVVPSKRQKYFAFSRHNAHGNPKRLSLHRKAHKLQRWFLKNPWIRPMCVFNFAVIKIQQHIRGYLLRKRIREFGVISDKQPFKDFLLNYRYRKSKAVTQKSKLPLKKNLNNQLNRYLLYLDKFRGDVNDSPVKQTTVHLSKPTWLEGGFSAWCSVRIQAWWRMLLAVSRYGAMKRLVAQVATIIIQTYWRNFHYYHKLKIPIYTAKENSLLLLPNKNELASVRIQRAWKSFCNRRIFYYLKSLILKTFLSIPVIDLLRYILPSEMQLLDRAAGIHLKFRLGGIFFPPKIYFKVFTHRPLCDINAFAPRDYTKEKPLDNIAINNHSNVLLRTFPAIAPQIKTTKTLFQHKVKYFDQIVSTTNLEGSQNWYSREENNAWRPIAIQSFQKLPVNFPNWLLKEYQYQQECLQSKPKRFHFSSVKRKMFKIIDQKKRKREWMLKLYLSQSRAMGYNPSSPLLPQRLTTNNGNISPQQEFEQNIDGSPPKSFKMESFKNQRESLNEQHAVAPTFKATPDMKKTSQLPPIFPLTNLNHNHAEFVSFTGGLPESKQSSSSVFQPTQQLANNPYSPSEKSMEYNPSRDQKYAYENRLPNSVGHYNFHGDDVNQLLDWSLALNFDDYLQEWNALGTSLPTDLPTSAIVYKHAAKAPT